MKRRTQISGLASLLIFGCVSPKERQELQERRDLVVYIRETPAIHKMPMHFEEMALLPQIPNEPLRFCLYDRVNKALYVMNPHGREIAEIRMLNKEKNEGDPNYFEGIRRIGKESPEYDQMTAPFRIK